MECSPKLVEAGLSTVSTASIFGKWDGRKYKSAERDFCILANLSLGDSAYV
jgi:hypothetical protein